MCTGRTHCLTVVVALGEDGRPAKAPHWSPLTPEDRRLEDHAKHLIELRARLAPVYPT